MGGDYDKHLDQLIEKYMAYEEETEEDESLYDNELDERRITDKEN